MHIENSVTLGSTSYKGPQKTTIDMSDQVNPPLVYEAIDCDIPLTKIYGKDQPTPEMLKSLDLLKLSSNWIESFNSALCSISEGTSLDSLDNLLCSHTCWKDHLSLTWDFHQYHGLEKIKEALGKQQPIFKLNNLKLNTKADTRYDNGISVITAQEASEEQKIPIQWVQIIFDFENKYGTGIGLIRLIPIDGKLKALSIYTGLQSISNNEENIGDRRPKGSQHGDHLNRKSWLERRMESLEFGEKKQPTVLVVGGGQGGLNLAARLKVMGVESLIVEKNKQIGDNWRNRYKFLVLHDPVWYDHLAYLNFPDNWPIFTPKDKLGDWFDSYAKSMELNVWNNKTVTGGDFDEETKTWRVDILDNETKAVKTLYPNHVVMATGHSGEPNIPQFKNQEIFKGTIVHSSKHSTGKLFKGENALVVGCCNSGHDIAQDFYEQGAKPIIIQRSSTCVVKSDIGLKLSMKGLYDGTGPSVEIADLMNQSMPIGLQNLMMQQVYRETCKQEKSEQDGLKKAGFKLDAGYGGTGLFGKYIRRGGGYYIDVGCSKLITEGKIKMKQGVSIKEFTEDGVILSDGSLIDNVAVVVLATGYSNMKDTAINIFGEKVGKRLNPIWGLDDEGEIKTIWRDSGHPNFYYMGGNLMLSRFYSKKLALKIIANEKNLC